MRKVAPVEVETVVEQFNFDRLALFDARRCIADICNEQPAYL
jgi:hypothetical protein